MGKSDAKGWLRSWAPRLLPPGFVQQPGPGGGQALEASDPSAALVENTCRPPSRPGRRREAAGSPGKAE